MIVTLMCANLIIRKIYKDGSPSVKVALSQHYNGSERPCKRFLRVRIYTINEKSNEKDATDILRKVFGDRFPNGEDANKDISDKTVAPINLGNEDSHFA